MAGSRYTALPKHRPVITTIILTVIGYSLVIGTFLDFLPINIYPDLTLAQVNLFSHIIAIVNTVTITLLALGWYYIRHNAVRKHRATMLSAFTLILLFLVLYLMKIGGGGTKEFVGPTLVYYGYLGMLMIHVFLSIVSVPLVVYQLVIGLTHPPIEIRRRTRHAQIGRIAVTAWILSLILGVTTYLLLNHLYSWRFVETSLLLS